MVRTRARRTTAQTRTDPEAELLDALAREQAVLATQVDQQTRVRQQAAAVGLDYNQHNLGDADPELLKRIFDTQPVTIENFKAYVESAASRRTAKTAMLTEAIVKARDAKAVVEQLNAREDDDQYITLYDPPQGNPPKHPGTSRFRIVDAAAAIRERNFFPSQVFAMRPEGTIACDYVSPAGAPCPKDNIGTKAELLAHKQVKHVEFWRQQEQAKVATRDELMTKALERMATVAEALTAGSGSRGQEG